MKNRQATRKVTVEYQYSTGKIAVENRFMGRLRLTLYLPGEMGPDLATCTRISNLSCNATILQAIRLLIRKARAEHPEEFPQPQQFSVQEQLILAAIDDACWSLADIVGHTGYQEAAARRLLKGLVERGILERRFLPRTEAARGKAPEIWVRPGTPAGSNYDARPSLRAGSAED